MLDDLKFIHEKDADDALGVAENQWKQLQQVYDTKFDASGEIRNIVLSGMGGSAWWSMFVASWPGIAVPFEISRNYEIPRYVDEHTLFVASSYSGNTEETLAALEAAAAKNAKIAVISAGGELAKRAEAAGYPLFRVPSGQQPRMSSFYMMTALVQLLEPLGLTPKGSLETLRGAGMWLKDNIADMLPTVPTNSNLAKRLAQELMGKTVIVYSGIKLFPAANKWKICMNENAKNLAWGNYLPELSHNEFIGWSGHPIDKPFAVVELRSNLEHPRVVKRFDVTDRMLSGRWPQPEVVNVKGETLIQQLLWTASLGDFTSLYLAFLNGINPTPVELVEKFKAELDK